MHRAVWMGVALVLLTGCGDVDCRHMEGILHWADVEACAERVQTIEGSLTLEYDVPARVALPALEEVSGTLWVYGRDLETLDVPLLHTVREVAVNGSLRELRLPSLRSGSLTAWDAEALERIDAPVLVEASSIDLERNLALREVSLPALRSVESWELRELVWERSPDPLVLDLSALEEVRLNFEITGTLTLRELRLPSLRRCLRFQLVVNAALAELDIGGTPEIEFARIVDNPLLSQCAVDELGASVEWACTAGCRDNGPCD